MKEKIKLVQKTYYVAADGTEFEDEYDCEAHETMVRAKEAEKKIEKVPTFSFTPDFVGDDNEWTWYYLTDENDLKTVKEWHSIQEWPGFDHRLDRYPCWGVVSNDRYDNEAHIEGNSFEIIDRLHECEAKILSLMEEKERNF